MRQEIPENSDVFYIVDETNDTFHIEGLGPAPKEFVKFYALTKNNVDAIVNNYLYGSHPFELNDPFDCYRGFQKINPIYNDSYWMLLYSKIGIISFTKKEGWNNSLMWGHYSQHEGFNVVLDSNDFCFDYHGPYPMNYIEKIPQDFTFEHKAIEFVFFATVKSNNWSYEKEWRIFPKSNGILKSPKIAESDFEDVMFLERKFYYKPNAIKEIILGYKFIFNEDSFSLNKKENNIILKTNSQLKIKLLTFIIKNSITVSIIELGDIYDFSLDKIGVSIEQMENNTFKFYL
jgi:hypothetical protein